MKAVRRHDKEGRAIPARAEWAWALQGFRAWASRRKQTDRMRKSPQSTSSAVSSTGFSVILI